MLADCVVLDTDTDCSPGPNKPSDNVLKRSIDSKPMG